MLELSRRTSRIGLMALAATFLVIGTQLTEAAGHRPRRSQRQAVCCDRVTLPAPAVGCGSQVPRCGVVPATPGPLPAMAPGNAIPIPVPPAKPPQPEVVQLGYSVLGVPITMHVFGEQGRTALIFGAIHGDEPNSGHLARQLLDHLVQHPEAYSGCRVAVIPVANPDGLVRSRRLNEHRIDLNRNFPASNWKVGEPGSYFGGQVAASEPETQAIIKAVELVQPDRIVSIHAITRGRECNNYDGPGAELAEVMKAKNGYRVAKSIGYPTPGSFGSWAGIDRQIATITLELPVDLPGPDCWQQHREALLAVIRFEMIEPRTK